MVCIYIYGTYLSINKYGISVYFLISQDPRDIKFLIGAKKDIEKVRGSGRERERARARVSVRARERESEKETESDT